MLGAIPRNKDMSKVILPGAKLGVPGSGQLGRMFALAARRMGYRVHVLSPDEDSPTGHIADVEISAAYDDLDAVARFAQEVAVVTFEFENVPALTAQTAARFAPVRPDYRVLHTTQNRLREKTTLAEQGLAVDAALWVALFAPTGTPQAIVDRLDEAVLRILKDEAVRKRLNALGTEASGISQKTFVARIRTDAALQMALEQLRTQPPRLVFYRPDDKYNTRAARALMDQVRRHYDFLEGHGGFEVYRSRQGRLPGGAPVDARRSS